MMNLTILLTIFLTSFLSGIFGMAGGMILMASLTLVYPLATAMIFHGLVQITANGSRCLFLKSHIIRNIMISYLIGALLATGTFLFMTIVPNKAVVFLILGSFPLAARALSKFRNLDITNNKTAISAGFAMTAVQLLAGVSGPVLDAFYQHSNLSRLEIVANKALSQTMSHFCKIIYYLTIMNTANFLPLWMILGGMPIAVLGTRFGTIILNKWNDLAFRKYSSYLISILSVICLARGLHLLTS